MIHTSLEGKIEQEVFEIERHIHNNEKSFGLAGTPAGETHRADRITLKPEPFQVDAGNDTWSAWFQVFGSSDTPVVSGSKEFDFNEFQIVNHERNSTVHVMQVITGESTELAAKLAAELFTEKTFITPSAPAGEMGTVQLTDTRCVAGQKVWVRIWAKGADTGTLDFYPAIHEYPR